MRSKSTLIYPGQCGSGPVYFAVPPPPDLQGRLTSYISKWPSLAPDTDALDNRISHWIIRRHDRRNTYAVSLDFFHFSRCHESGMRGLMGVGNSCRGVIVFFMTDGLLTTQIVTNLIKWFICVTKNTKCCLRGFLTAVIKATYIQIKSTSHD